jgi:hypothetical protein
MAPPSPKPSVWPRAPSGISWTVAAVVIRTCWFPPTTGAVRQRPNPPNRLCKLLLTCVVTIPPGGPA